MCKKKVHPYEIGVSLLFYFAFVTVA